MEKAEKEKTSQPEIYPVINIPHIQNPNRFYAIPLLGFLAKLIVLIPVGIELVVLWVVNFFVTMIINPFIVLVTGKYWKTAYEFNLGLMRLTAKTYYYVFGLTDKYPGFNFEIKDNYNLEMAYPENPNRFFAIPVLGGFVRIVLLIPYLIYSQVISYASNIGVFVSFVPVLFMGKYPESTYELARDSVRVGMGGTAYMSGLSDKYPSFYISMNHRGVKIILIILGILAVLGNFSTGKSSKKSTNYKFDNTNIQQYYPNVTIPQELQ